MNYSSQRVKLLFNNNCTRPKCTYCDINISHAYSDIGFKESEMENLKSEQIKNIFGGIWDLNNETQEPELPTFEL